MSGVSGVSGQVGMDEPVSPITLALVLRQIMPSLAIAQAGRCSHGPSMSRFSRPLWQVDDMVSAHMLEKAMSKAPRLQWLL